MRYLLTVLMVLGLAASGYGLEKKAIQLKEDFGTEPLYTCYMNYYYYIPCPTNSWFWAFSGWTQGQTIGEWFRIGDPSMGRTGSGCPPYIGCDPCGLEDKSIERFRVLDFAGYGTTYPGLFTVRFDIWCCDAYGYPVGPDIWSSGPKELAVAGWNYIDIYPGLPADVYSCGGGFPLHCYPTFLITATHIGTLATYPAWGFDDISKPVSLGCAMHDNGCCPALYPRPQVSHYTAMHSGDYGINWAQIPPTWFLDPGDTTGNTFGFIELAWRVYLGFHVGTEPSTWGTIKAIYK
jgi:hypothetical protein